MPPCVQFQHLSISNSVLTVALAACCLHGTASSAAPDWSELGRQASIFASSKQFDKASRSYEDAIKCLQQKNPLDQTLYDLYLNLSDTYRLAGDTARARLMLEKCAPVTLRDNWDDPLLPARYWRRVATIERAEGNIGKTMCAEAMILNVFAAHFDESAPIVTRCTDNYVNSLIYACTLVQSPKDFEALVRSAQLLKNPAPAIRHRVASVLESRAKQGFSSGSPDEIASMLGRASAVADNKPLVISVWQHFVENLPPTASTASLNLAKESLKNLVNGNGTSPGAALTAHLLLARLYHLTNDPQSAMQEVAAVGKMATFVNQSDWDSIQSYCDFCFLHGKPIPVRPPRLQPGAVQFSQEACDLSSLYLHAVPSDRRPQVLDAMARYRLVLARVLSLAGRAREAAKVSESMLADGLLPSDNQRFLRQYIYVNVHIARLLLLSKDEAAASALFAKLIKLSNGFTDTAAGDKVREWIELSSKPTSSQAELDRLQELMRPAFAVPDKAQKP